jgi:hypothetical protein
MSTIHEYILWLCWGLLTLCHKPLKNPVHDMLFPTVEVMEKRLSSISFPIGLLEVLLSPLPPTINWMKSLPTQSRDLWGVYIILLEKPNCRPRIYIGSGTTVTRHGLEGRFKDYNFRTRMPLYIGKAVDEGYTITHKGVLCWTTIPPATGRFPMRSLMILLETTFSLSLWAMHSRTKTYGMPSLLSWALDSVRYDGCCSHAAISEKVWGEDEGLTIAQIAAKEAEMDSRRAEQDKEARQRYYAKRNAADFEGWRQRKNALLQKSNQKIRASKKWACKPCNLVFHSEFAFNKHKTRAAHLAKVTGSRVYKHPDQKQHADAVKAAKTHHCRVCDASFQSASALLKHENGPKHIQRMSEAGL